jgi:hypothetical protein
MRVIMFVTAAIGLIATSLAGQEFRWHGRLAQGATLEVRGITGAIRASRAGGSEAEVVAVKHGARHDVDEVEIRVVEQDGGVTICAAYPSRHGRQAAGCSWDGQHDLEDSDVEVEFEVRVPPGVRFLGGTVTGDVEGRALPGDATLTTVNGDVDVEADGVARATTVNGSISARLGRNEWEGQLRFTTVNGGITVTFPGDLNADIQATTVNGSVESDFPITLSGRMHAGSLRGRLGNGGRDLSLSTVNGDIRLRRGG